MKKYKLGYTTGVYDLFHIGHLNLLMRAKEQCDFLVVGVTTDNLVSYKSKRAVIPFEERIEIIRALRCVDMVIPQNSMDKFRAWEALKFDAMFVGDDWKGTETWKNYEQQFSPLNVDIVYLPYTLHTSSTKLRDALNALAFTQKAV